MGTYLSKVVEVEAVQYTGDNYQEMKEFAGDNISEIDAQDRGDDPDCDLELLSSAHSNWIHIYKDDWVMRRDGNYSRVNNDTFQQNYEEKK